MLWDMNVNGIYISTGSSCSSEDLESSAVVDALGEHVELPGKQRRVLRQHEALIAGARDLEEALEPR